MSAGKMITTGRVGLAWDRKRSLIAVLAGFILTALILSSFPTRSVSSISHSTPQSKTSHWPGWEGIEHMIVFGDSYTSTGFSLQGAGPSAANPMGNPEYPGFTSSNGPNWIDFLTTTYNATFVKTVNLAVGGATVDSDLVEPFMPGIPSLKQQIHEQYLPFYSSPPTSFQWRADNTLFAIWMGINDINNAYAAGTASQVLDQVISVYAESVDVLYQSGARNFLLLSVPPFDLAPVSIAQGPTAQADKEYHILSFNERITALATNLSTTYHDATLLVFNAHEVFRQALETPCTYEETCRYKNTTQFCNKYVVGTPTWHTFYPECGVSVDQYFWLDDLHPTYRIMNATAREIAKQLSSIQP